ncbi:RNA-directed DNA polymerase [Balamuthia mandrillaris]
MPIWIYLSATPWSCHNLALGRANPSLSHNAHKGEIRLGWFLTEITLRDSHIISRDGCLPDLEKISTFSTLPISTTRKQKQSILGFINLLWDYIPHYAEIMAPLEPLRNVPGHLILLE